jgi:hypothetical protein
VVKVVECGEPGFGLVVRFKGHPRAVFVVESFFGYDGVRDKGTVSGLSNNWV